MRKPIKEANDQIKHKETSKQKKQNHKNKYIKLDPSTGLGLYLGPKAIFGKVKSFCKNKQLLRGQMQRNKSDFAVDKNIRLLFILVL